MKRKFAYNNSQISQTDGFNNINTSSYRGNYTYNNSRTINGASQNVVKIDKNRKNFQNDYLNDQYLNSARGSKITYTPKGALNFVNQRTTINSQKRSLELKKGVEDIDSTYKEKQNKRKHNLVELVEKEELLCSQTDVNKNLESKRANLEIKNLPSIEESISTGIRSQLIYSFMGKSEFLSLTQSIMCLLSFGRNKYNDELEVEKSRCILHLDHLILRAKKLNEILEINALEEYELSGANTEFTKKNLSEFQKFSELVNEEIIQMNFVHSSWDKCEALCESVNSMKDEKDIQDLIFQELIKINELNAEISKKKMKLSEKTRRARAFYEILLNLIS